jgi:hypothetical protein
MIGTKKLVEREKLCCGRVNVANCSEQHGLSRKDLTIRRWRRGPAIQHLAIAGRPEGSAGQCQCCSRVTAFGQWDAADFAEWMQSDRARAGDSGFHAVSCQFATAEGQRQVRETLNWRKFLCLKNGNWFERCQNAYCQIPP